MFKMVMSLNRFCNIVNLKPFFNIHSLEKFLFFVHEDPGIVINNFNELNKFRNKSQATLFLS